MGCFWSFVLNVLSQIIAALVADLVRIKGKSKEERRLRNSRLSSKIQKHH
ncbi:hypothetical protein [Zhaonella formicivorans]|nr:hypothetical protein [Zhaonella formicivorans]